MSGQLSAPSSAGLLGVSQAHCSCLVHFVKEILVGETGPVKCQFAVRCQEQVSRAWGGAMFGGTGAPVEDRFLSPKLHRLSGRPREQSQQQ